MKRKLMQKLLAWKERPEHLPILLYGARQIGKTYLLHEFGNRYFAQIVYINFEADTRLNDYLDTSIEPAYVLDAIEKIYHCKPEWHNTLLFFDEIQASERALTALKYFAEQAPKCYVVAAGSLLGVKINREKFSFPVGKVCPINMYPLDFEEFLWAKGQELLAESIRQSYISNKPLPELLHAEALRYYREYILVGGMPKAVLAFLNSEDYRAEQEGICTTYVADMAKYTERSESVRVADIYNSLPQQLAKENKKFQYKLVKKGGRAAQYSTALAWLVQAGLALQCKKVNHGYLPLAAYQEADSFKLYYGDSGLFSARSRLNEQLLSLPGTQQIRGSLAENYLACSLQANGYELNYWASDYDAEVDFILQTEEGIVPIECKADVYVRSRSLEFFRKKYQPLYALRVSARNFGFENGLKSIPLYAAFCI